MEQIYFVLFTVAVAGTPGPSNALLTAAGARIGFRRGLPSLLGQATGMGAMLFAVTLGLGNLLLAHPLALTILKWGGAALLCWMAWRIATAASASDGWGTHPVLCGRVAHPSGRGLGQFLGMAAFQWVNPKGWLISVAAVGTFLDRHSGGALAQAAIFAILFTLVAIPSCLPWLAFGAALQRFLHTPRAWRVFNCVMAALLAASAILLACTRL